MDDGAPGKPGRHVLNAVTSLKGPRPHELIAATRNLYAVPGCSSRRFSALWFATFTTSMSCKHPPQVIQVFPISSHCVVIGQTKVSVYQTLVLPILLYASETWTSLASDMRAIESFHMKCQRRIIGIKWHDFVRNSEVSLRTGLAPVSDRITRGRNAIVRHVARLPVNTPAHQAMLRQVELSVGRPPDPTWKRPPGRPHTKWTDQLRRDNNNVPIATPWRQAIGRSHSRVTLRSEPTTC